jgi:hypothetical protein
VLPEAVPPEAVPPEAVPPEAVPPEAVPPEAVPPEALPPEALPPVEICTTAEEAAERTSAGVDVVLILPEGTALVRPPGPGRVAVLVGGAGAAADRAAAAAMGAELFRA